MIIKSEQVLSYFVGFAFQGLLKCAFGCCSFEKLPRVSWPRMFTCKKLNQQAKPKQWDDMKQMRKKTERQQKAIFILIQCMKLRIVFYPLGGWSLIIECIGKYD